MATEEGIIGSIQEEGFLAVFFIIHIYLQQLVAVSGEIFGQNLQIQPVVEIFEFFIIDLRLLLFN